MQGQDIIESVEKQEQEGKIVNWQPGQHLFPAGILRTVPTGAFPVKTRRSMKHDYCREL